MSFFRTDFAKTVAYLLRPNVSVRNKITGVGDGLAVSPFEDLPESALTITVTDGDDTMSNPGAAVPLGNSSANDGQQPA
jgi:hypothetical protein